jgi:protein O-mannosyl-transferase
MKEARKKKRQRQASTDSADHTKAGSLKPSNATEVPLLLMAQSILSGGGLWVSVGLIAVVLAVYAPVREYDFVTWDDPQYVSENPQVLEGLTASSVQWAFTTGHAGLWIPLTWLSYLVDVEIYGKGAGGHHISNVLLHLVTTLLLFGLFRRMTGALGRSAFVAALFAVHPLHVESVAWITERKDTLSTLFGVLTIWAYVAYVRRPGIRRYAAMAALFAAGLMAKPMVVTLPLVLLLLDVWPLGRVPQSEAWRATSVRLVQEKLPLIVIAVVSSVVTFMVQQRAGAVSGLEGVPLLVRLENASVSYVAYIGKMLWPTKLAGLYPYRLLPVALVAGSILLLTIISSVVIRAYQRYPYLIVGWLWYLCTLLPVIGLVQVGIQSRADRFTYIPLIGIFIMIAWGLPDLMVRWDSSSTVLPAVSLIVLAACAVTARGQLQYWKNSLVFWQHTVAVTSENARAHGNLGLVLSEQGKTTEAIAHYTEALRIRADLEDVHNNLANSLAGQGKASEAIVHYKEALRLKPDKVEAHNGLGALLDEQGKFDEAIAEYKEALRIQPDSATTHNNLGVALVNQRKFEEAIGQFLEASRIKPDDADFHYNAAVTLETAGRTQEAEPHFEAVVKLNPQNADARRKLEALRSGAR